MKKESIKLNSEISVDLEKLIEGGMVILANSGGGKSYLIRRIAEQSVNKVQTIIIDPEGEFSSLREKYDFILAGKDADVPAEPRSAALLATKLLELNKSAVIDLYELHPQERQRFVKLFCDALVNAPKSLYHPVLIILDEAHEYVPEGKPSEATWAVESLASKGRKRGQRLILASQRIAKISKNVTAEANNKLIGRASQDIDMKRAGDELGFNKESLKQLRQLRPGEFFAFGPAISDEVIKLKIGEVKTHHAKVGYKGVGKIPPASDVIKKVLAGLKDLPKEAEKEAKSTAELKKQNTELKKLLTIEKNRKVDMGKTVVDLDYTTNEVNRIMKLKDREIIELQKKFHMYVKDWFKYIKMSATGMESFLGMPIIIDPKLKEREWKLQKPPIKISTLIRHPDNSTNEHLITEDQIIDDKPMGAGERTVLIAIASQIDGMSREHITIQTGYKRSTRDAYIQRLQQKGFVQISGGKIYATDEGKEALGNDYQELPTGSDLIDHHLKTLPEGEAKILRILVEADGAPIDRETITIETGYQRSTRDAYIQRLGARQLVETEGRGMVKAHFLLFQ